MRRILPITHRLSLQREQDWKPFVFVRQDVYRAIS